MRLVCLFVGFNAALGCASERQTGRDKPVSNLVSIVIIYPHLLIISFYLLFILNDRLSSAHVLYALLTMPTFEAEI